MMEVEHVCSEMDTRISEMEYMTKTRVEDAKKQSSVDITKTVDSVTQKTQPTEDKMKGSKADSRTLKRH